MKKFLSILAVLITAAVLVVAGACASEDEREDVFQTNMSVQEQAVGGEASETVGNTKSELKNDSDSLIGADGIAAGEVGERASGCPRLKVSPGSQSGCPRLRHIGRRDGLSAGREALLPRRERLSKKSCCGRLLPICRSCAQLKLREQTVSVYCFSFIIFTYNSVRFRTTSQQMFATNAENFVKRLHTRI